MSLSYKILGQSAPSDTNEATLYTVPSETQSVVSTLTISNLTSTAADASVYFKDSGAAISNSNTFFKDVEIAANSAIAITIGITLDSTDVVSVKSGTADALAFQIFGSEIT